MLYFLFEIEHVATLRGHGLFLCPGIPLRPPEGWDPKKTPASIGSRIVVQCPDGAEIRTTIAGLDYPPSGPTGREAQAILVRIEETAALVGAKVYLEAEDVPARDAAEHGCDGKEQAAFVTRLSADDMEQPATRDMDLDQPTWEDVETAIRRLDGERFTLVMLGTGTDAHMGIGGGKDDRYILYATFGDEQFHNLRGSVGHGKVSMVCGGQRVTYDESRCCSLAAVLAAASAFYKSGTLDETLAWVGEDKPESPAAAPPHAKGAATNAEGWSGQMPLDLLHTISVISRCLILSRGLPLRAGDGQVAFHYLDAEIVTEHATGLRRLLGIRHRQPLADWLATAGPKTKGAWLQWRSSAGVPEQWQVAQFAGCTVQQVLVSSDNGDLVLHPSWKLVRHGRRDWRVEYTCEPIEHAAARSESPAVDIDWFEGVLEATVQLAQELDLNEFVPTFRNAITFAASDEPAHPMFRRLLDERVFLPEAARLLETVARAWVFGTFGAWNDQRFDNGAQRRTYNTGTARLWEANRGAVLSAVNRLRRDAPSTDERTETEK